MDHVIYREACDEERKSGVDTVCPRDSEPCCSEVLGGLCAVQRILRMPLGATKGTFGLMCSDKLDYVGDEKMARNEQVEDKAEKYVLPTIIVAAYTYENSVLEIVSGSHQSKHVVEMPYLHEVFNDKSQIHYNFASS